MSFENIGIGGTLSFDHKGAVTNMGVAARGFARLETAVDNASAAVSRIGHAMGSFSLMGHLGIAGMAYEFKKLVHEGMEWDAYVEQTKISIGTIMAAVTKTPLADNIAGADKVLQHLNVVATQTHVETSEVVDTFSRLVGPMMGAGASMNEIYDFTKGTTIMASALHQPVNRAAHAMSLMAGGTLMAREQTVQLLHSMGLLHETSQQWAAYLPEQRMKRMKEIMATFAESGEYLQHTWAAQSSSAKSFFKIMAGAFTKGMFQQGTDALSRFNDAFLKHQDEWLDKINRFGQVFSEIIGFLSNEVKKFYGTITSMVGFIQSHLAGLNAGPLAGIAKTVAHVVAQFVLFASVMSPVISVVGFLVSKFAAVYEIVMGLGELLIGLAAPLWPFIAAGTALFLLFRHQGESVMETFRRLFNFIQEVGDRLWAPIADQIGVVKTALNEMRATGYRLWLGIQPGLEDFKAGLKGIINLVIAIWDTVAPLIGKIITGAVSMFQAIRPGIQAVFNGVMEVFRTVVDGLNYLWPKISAILGPIVETVISIGKHAATLIGKLLLALKPLYDGIAWILREVIFPVAGWLLDTFGPAVTFIFQKVGDLINWIADKIGWVADKLSWVVDKVKSVGSFIGDTFAGNSMEDMVKQLQEANKAGQEAQVSSGNWLGMMQDGMKNVWNTAQGVTGMIQFLSQHLSELYDTYAKPIVDAGVTILNHFIGDTKLNVKNPDNVVKISQDINTSMCVDGHTLASSQARYTTEVSERAGYNKTPWQAQRVQVGCCDPKKT